jgi:hypothetical protein
MSAVRGLILSTSERLDDVRALAVALDARFGGISVRAFALKGGHALCPPGGAFVGSIEACPDAFLDIVFLDPVLNDKQRSKLSRCLAPGAEISGGDVKPPARQPDLDTWMATRAEYVARLLDRGSKADSWIASTATLDDLVLESIDAHADRLFGQRRRKTLETPGFAVPDGSTWRALMPPPEGTLANLWPEEPSFWSRLFGRAKAAPSTLASNSVATALAEGVRQGRQIAVSLPATGRPVCINVMAETDAPAFAMGLANGLGKRDVLVRVVDRSSSRLGAFLLVYKELRFSCRGRVVFRWCPAPEALPLADLTLSKRGKAWESDPSSAVS